MKTCRPKQKQQTNRNWAIWLVYQTDTNARGFWLVKRTLGWKNFMPENFLEINRYFALTSYCNMIGKRTVPSLYKGFLWRENEESMFWSLHSFADKTNNKHLPKPFFKVLRKSLYKWNSVSLIKQLTFLDVTTGFPAQWCLRNGRRNSILMTFHYPHLGSASDWLKQISHAERLIIRGWSNQWLDNAIHRINHYPLDNAIGFLNTYPADSYLFSG